jgi:hypothetical protein
VKIDRHRAPSGVRGARTRLIISGDGANATQNYGAHIGEAGAAARPMLAGAVPSAAAPARPEFPAWLQPSFPKAPRPHMKLQLSRWDCGCFCAQVRWLGLCPYTDFSLSKAARTR